MQLEIVALLVKRLQEKQRIGRENPELIRRPHYPHSTNYPKHVSRVYKDPSYLFVEVHTQ